MKTIKEQVCNHADVQFCTQVWDQVDDHVDGHVRGHVCDQVGVYGAELKEHIREGL